MSVPVPLICTELLQRLEPALSPPPCPSVLPPQDPPTGGLTRGNPHLSEPTSDLSRHDLAPPLARAERPIDLALPAIDCTPGISVEVAELVARSVSENTRRAYRADMAHFAAWGGTLPASPAVVANYLAEHVETLGVATLVRRLATLSKAHEALGLPNPCRSDLVRATLRGIKRTRGTAQRQAKPLLREDLTLILDCLGETPRDQRDRALLLIGFAGAFRRSELVGLDVGDVAHVRQGLVITLRRSKTDQEGAGRTIGVPHGRTRLCPVAALDGWLHAANIGAGPIFRPVDRHSHVLPARLSGEAVAVIVRERAVAACLDPSRISGHSLRAGFVTSAAQAGLSTLKIRNQSGHASDAMLARYVRDAELFVGNAAGALL